MNNNIFAVALIGALLATTCAYATSVEGCEQQNSMVIPIDTSAGAVQTADLKEPKNTSVHMSCEDFLALDTQAQTPVVFWVSNLDPNDQGNDDVDERQIDEFVTPMVIEECHKTPALKLVDLKSKIEQYIQRHF
ncbi:HdeA/HdeB family chaperone [Hafnia paralvei]